MIDTHSHIQFKVFDKTRRKVLERAKNVGVEKIIAVGTDLESSKKAVEIAQIYPEVFASVGIHPHHVFPFTEQTEIATSALPPRNDVIAISRSEEAISELEGLINHPKVVAIGETGIDKHIYKITKYPNYLISNQFLNLQKEMFGLQIKLALKHGKALIIHNRKAAKETLEVLEKNWDDKLKSRSVFHFCDPDLRLFDYAISHNIFIGADADVLTDANKQEFVKNIPLELLVLETDSPFMLPESSPSVSLRGSADRRRRGNLDSGQARMTNEPANLKLILEFISKLLKTKPDKLEREVSKNCKNLFQFMS